jgi:4'-phosphopantetheinyl transferase EntD
MAGLGITSVAVPVRDDGGPSWPSSVIGSLSHWERWCAAAVMQSGTYQSLGIDGEGRRLLPGGVRALIATHAERAWLDGQDAAKEWDTALFTMKEAVYKAWAPVTGRWLEFQDVEIAIDVEAAVFRAEVKVGDRCQPGSTEFYGHFAFEADSVLAVALLPRATDEVPSEFNCVSPN